MFRFASEKMVHVMTKIVVEDVRLCKWNARAILAIPAEKLDWNLVMTRIRKMVDADMRFKKLDIRVGMKVIVTFDQLDIGSPLIQYVTNGTADVTPGCKMFWEALGQENGQKGK